MAVARQRTNGKQPELLAVVQENSSGIRKGVVVSPEKVAERIRFALEKASSTINQRIKEVIINIGGSHLFITTSRGVVAVSRADQQISQEDIERVIAAAQAFSLPSNKEILEVVPKEFIVDGEGKIKDALGMKGIRLEAEILAICGFSPYLKNLTSALSLAEVDILDIVPSALASSRTVLTARQKELGVAVLDIGAWTTNMAVFEEGELIHLAIFPIGSSHITNDIAIGLQTDIDLAERIKREDGSCLYQRKKKGGPDKIEVLPPEFSEDQEGEGEEDEAAKKAREKEKRKNALVFPRKFLIEIIEARVSEIFDEGQKELKKIGKVKLLPAGIILTGGGAKLPEIDSFAKKEFKLPCQIGFPKGITGLAKDTSLATVCGLLLQGLDLEAESRTTEGNGLLSKMRRMFRIFVP